METKLCKDDAYNVLGIINSWINNIDTKASFAIAFAGVLIGVFMNNNNTHNIFENFCDSLIISTVNIQIFFDFVIVFVLLLCNVISIVLLLLSIKGTTKNNTEHLSLTYFGHISKIGKQDYISKMVNTSENDFLEDLLEQIHINAAICNRKLTLYNYGLRVLIVSITIYFIALICNII